MKIEFDALCARVGLRRRLLVVAPHPDDETIGCGGLIAHAASAGLDVDIVVVTDGAASHPGSHTWPPSRLAQQRKQELQRALRVLGVERPPAFLDLPDAGTPALRADQRLQAQATLAALIGNLEPDLVLTSWRREPHCDHRFSYDLTREAMQAVGSAARCMEYIVWTYVIGSVADLPKPGETTRLRLNIDKVRATKRAALAMHQSQLGQLILNDPGGFALTPDQIEMMTSGDEQFEVDPQIGE